MRVFPLVVGVACGAHPADSTKESNTDSNTDSQTDSSPQADDCRFFPAGAPWYQEVHGHAVDPASDVVIGALQ